jgi:hypothetical protein
MVMKAGVFYDGRLNPFFNTVYKVKNVTKVKEIISGSLQATDAVKAAGVSPTTPAILGISGKVVMPLELGEIT